MSYRTGLEIKKEILALLKKHPCVISEMERKVKTSDKVLHRHLKELEFLGIIELIRYDRSPNTGRPYMVAKIK